jgi:hypothetical protein
MKINNITFACLDEHTHWPVQRPVSDDLFVLEFDHAYRLKVWTKINLSYSIKMFIPKGFLNDKRSSPRPLWFSRPRDGFSEIASLLHDSLYRTQGFTKNMDLGVQCFCIDTGFLVSFSRKACDQIYKFIYQSTAPGKTDEVKRDYFWLRVAGAKYFGSRVPPSAKILTEKDIFDNKIIL